MRKKMSSQQPQPVFNILSTKEPVRTNATDWSIKTRARTALTEALARQYSAPPYLILFVSSQCWMHCSHCWFSEDWKEAHHKRPLLTFDQFSRLAESCRLHFVSFTGGKLSGVTIL